MLMNFLFILSLLLSLFVVRIGLLALSIYSYKTARLKGLRHWRLYRHHLISLACGVLVGLAFGRVCNLSNFLIEGVVVLFVTCIIGLVSTAFLIFEESLTGSVLLGLLASFLLSRAAYFVSNDGTGAILTFLSLYILLGAAAFFLDIGIREVRKYSRLSFFRFLFTMSRERLAVLLERNAFRWRPKAPKDVKSVPPGSPKRVRNMLDAFRKAKMNISGFDMHRFPGNSFADVYPAFSDEDYSLVAYDFVIAGRRYYFKERLTFEELLFIYRIAEKGLKGRLRIDLSRLLTKDEGPSLCRLEKLLAEERAGDVKNLLRDLARARLDLYMV
jgi:large-conductance mechanosensitive channel